MGINLDLIRARLNEQKGKEKRADILWKPKDGPNTIRIVPLTHQPEDPFIELYFHYLMNKTYLSPISFGKPDPIAAFSDSLISGGNLSKEDYKDAKKLYPNKRTFVAVVDRADPVPTIKYWSFGKTVYNAILDVLNDPDYGDITDPMEGRDIKVEFIPKEKSDTTFPKTNIRVAVKQTALTSDATVLKTLLTDQPDLLGVYKQHTPEELSAVLDLYVNGGQPDTSTSSPASTTPTVGEEGEWGSDAPAVSPTAEKAKSVIKAKKAAAVDVEAEFSKMFDKEKA